MTILVTGGAGYLGSVLCPLLTQRGWQVRILDSLLYGRRSLDALAQDPHIEFVEGDLRDEATVKAALAGIDAVVHLAAIVGDPACSHDPALARAINLDASLRLIRLAAAQNVKRFIFASTCSNYGRMLDTAVPATEDHELKPLSLYAETKVAVERQLLSQAAGDMAVTVLRFATLYGLSPRMRFDLTVNEFVLRMLVERTLVVYGEQFWRPYVHVRDAAAAIATVLGARTGDVAGRVFNAGDTAENYRKSDLLEIIEKRTGPADVKFVAVQQDPRDYRVSFERIHSDLGYAIERRVPDGVDEIASAIESHALTDFADPAYYNTAMPA
jgi:nucleoside-diphosphate-sugar epimerase